MYDVLVIGGGHAGIEASLSAAKLGCRTALVSMDINTVGRLSCNPSIGGTAKGHLAKEIDALGGVMGRLADASGLQFKILNKSKGPAVWSPRSQNDNRLYPLYAQNTLRSQRNLDIVKATITEIKVENDRVVGVLTSNNEYIKAKAVILCGGTFLNGVMWTGTTCTAGGRVGESASHKISDLLNDYGIEKGRLKTGTPPRIDKNSVDLKHFEQHSGDEPPIPFSIHTEKVKNQLSCWATRTSLQTHDILREGFAESPMFTGLIHGAGPRYCPSIEDKVNRFAERDSHQIVLEQESVSTDTLYVNGFSTSLPYHVQERALHSIKGLENAKVLKAGYAVEYDFFFPYQLRYTLETKSIQGLYFAGQINGTSGYEEAASQGLIAGINAALKIKEKDPFVLRRSDAYIGVMIDDLVNKNTEEPYRIFTSLAEYRLLLRTDTVYDRLLPRGHSIGLVSDELVNSLAHSQRYRKSIDQYINSVNIISSAANELLQRFDEDNVTESTRLITLARRPSIPLHELLNASEYPYPTLIEEKSSDIEAVQIGIKYEGYIQKQIKDMERFAKEESTVIPDAFDYASIVSLSTEAREKLMKIRPHSLGQASRIPGVSATDINLLSIYLR